MRYVSPRQFKSMVRRKEAAPDLAIRKALVGVATQEADRAVRFTISTATPDRSNDVIMQAGWDLTDFRRNPVVLWSHRGDEPPIGRCVEIGLKDGDLSAIVEYVPADMPRVGDLAEMCLRMNLTGFLSATSVGFRPLEWDVANERDDDEDSWFPPINYLKMDLLEFSLCSIPCNPDALIDPASIATDTPLLDLTNQDAERSARGMFARERSRMLRQSMRG